MESLTAPRHLTNETTDAVSSAAASSGDTVRATTTALHVQDDIAVIADEDSSSARVAVRDEVNETSRSDAQGRHNAGHAHAAAIPALQLGDPLALAQISGETEGSAHSAEPADAAALEPRAVDSLAGSSDAVAAADSGGVSNAAPAPETRWRDLPAPNPQEIAWPTPADESDLSLSVEGDSASDTRGTDVSVERHGGELAADEHTAITMDDSVEISAGSRDDNSDTSNDESQTTDEDEAHNLDVASLDSAEFEVMPEAEPEALFEPEPLVEPSPLPRSPFEPDLSKVGRPEAVAPAQNRSPVRPVRPLGDEPVFTTADRLRASGFAPVASERVSEQPAPPRESVDSASDVASISGTAPRISEAFETQPRDAMTGSNGGPDSNVGPAVEGTRANDHTAMQSASARLASSEAVCAQCGESLSESDIFCGSCGFVKHGVGPTSRSTSAPALDPFPWGTPTVRASTVTETAEPKLESGPELKSGPKLESGPESNSQQTQEVFDEPAGVAVLPEEVAHAEESAPHEEPPQAHNAELEPDSALAPLADELSRDENVTHDDYEAGARIPSAVDDAVVKVDSVKTSFEPLSAVPHPGDGEGQSEPEGVQSSAANDGAAAALGSSVLAPPPMFHHRVELPIAPPTPLASVASDEEDVEDTRIVERSISGTRFVLQFSTGDSVIVTGTGLVGRNPTPEPSEKFDIVVPITDPSKSVSKTHLEFGQMAGAFWISDRYSGNGSVVREPGGEPKRCEPGKRYRVMRGTRVEIGEQFFIVS
ncbi:FHA domain-containing protein [Salinibacterium sp. TMP30]|uniref:FHA domain-containing protein n=1 Tax=Salinibacterium sp. TMP30 TaxID=3138237 RepID=UPI00313877FA